MPGIMVGVIEMQAVVFACNGRQTGGIWGSNLSWL